MTRLAAAAAIIVLAAPAHAHHAYGDILRDQTVSVAGVVEDILFANPHVRIRLRSDDGRVHAIEWGNITQLARRGVDKDAVKVGDRLVITGSPHRDPALHLLTLLSEVRRPADGWIWSRERGAERVTTTALD